MALYRVVCSVCLTRGEEFLDFWTPGAIKCSAPLKTQTGACGGELVRDADGTTGASLVETLDSGAMSKPLTRYVETERLHEERRATADPNAGGIARVTHYDKEYK